MRPILWVLLLCLTACATADVADSDALDKRAAYVSVVPTASVGQLDMDRIDLTLCCTDLGGTHYEPYLPKLATRRATIVKVRPGTCYVAQVRGLLSTQGRLDPKETLFATKPDQLNFPGVWAFRFRLTHGLSVATPSQMSTTLDFALSVTEHNVDVARGIISRQFPSITQRLPLEYTRVVESPK